MPSKKRRRVEIGRSNDGIPIYKWACGKSTIALNLSIANIHMQHALIEQSVSQKMVSQQKIAKHGITFQEYVSNWLEIYKVPKLKPTTLQGYRGTLSKHLYPSFGKQSMDSITAESIQIFLNERKHLAKKTLKEMLTFLSEIFSDAIEDGHVTTNPAQSRKISIPSTKENARKALSEKQIISIIQQIHSLEGQERRLMALLLMTGMRRGEVLGLRWEDIDAPIGLISVSRNVTYAKNQPHIDTPKSEKGTREIPLDPHLWALLQPTEPKGYIIGGEAPISRMAYRRMWERIEKRIDLHGATAHIFRHSYLTIASNAGIEPKTIQALGGHADISTTMNIYVHKQTDQILEAGKKISVRLQGQKTDL